MSGYLTTNSVNPSNTGCAGYGFNSYGPITLYNYAPNQWQGYIPPAPGNGGVVILYCTNTGGIGRFTLIVAAFPNGNFSVFDGPISGSKLGTFTVADACTTQSSISIS